MTRFPRRHALSLVVVILGMVVGAVTLTAPLGGTRAPTAAATGAMLELRPLSTSADHRIVDDLGRDVLLRGANLNSLGRYWQGVPSLAPTIPVTDADWDAMAAHGFSVVRLIVTWSRIEPDRGVIDQGYLDRVEAAVDAAAARGIYTVVDMHQDAYTDAISTLDATSCPAGTSPAKGWDGAPAWATLTDGLSTCLNGGDRNSSDAVTRAWNHFYDDTDGIRTHFTQAWAAVATRLAGRPEVAGYDLLNEPEVSRPAAELTPLYEDLIRDTVTAIRDAEHAAGAGFDHLVFVEPGVPAADFSRGLMIPSVDRIGLGNANVVSAPHNYAESISQAGLDVTLEAFSDLIDTLSAGMGLPVWIGEYGFWDTRESTLAIARRYATNEDTKRQGGAWWQWRQSCGDPHAVQWSAGAVVAPTATQVHLNVLDCPANTDGGPNDAFLRIVGRAYPRATPGRLTELTSDPDTGTMALAAIAGSGDVGRTLEVWAPTVDGVDRAVHTDGLADVTATAVPGGRIVTARVTTAGTYRLSLEEALPPPPSSTTTAPATTPETTAPGATRNDRVVTPTASAARPVAGDPTYTG